MPYNATVYDRRPDGRYDIFVAEVAEIDGQLVMLRSNAAQCTGFEGSPTYDAHMRRCMPEARFEIVLDNCAGYKARLAGLGISPHYKV